MRATTASGSEAASETVVGSIEQAQAERARSERFARSVVEASADCVKGLSLDGRLLWMNDNGQRLMEVCDFETLKGCDWVGFWEAGGGRAQAEAALAVARAGGIGRFSGSCPTAAGSPRWWDVAITPIPGPDGRPEQLLCVSRDITDRRAAEERLRQSVGTFRHLVEQSPFGVYIVDADFRVALVSQGAQRTFASVQPVLGRDFAEVMRVLWPEPSATTFIGLFRRTLDTGEPYFAPALVERRADLGDVESYDWKIERVTLPDGRFGVVCHFYDLSERQRLEAARQESESFYRQTLESIPGMVFTNREDGACDYVSEQWAAFTGVPAAAQLDDGWVQVLHPDDRERAFAAWRAAVEGRGQYDVEYRVRRAGGGHEWFKVRGRALRDAEGRIARWFGAAINIDDLKATEAALALRERELQTLADNTPDILTRFDRQHRHLFVNAAVERATGCPAAAFPGRTNRELGMPDSLCARWDEALRAVFESGQPRSLDFEFMSPQGLHYYSTRLVPEPDETGAVACVLGVTRDVTEQRRYQRSLEEQDRRKDEFLATLAHELRNPLAPIRNGLAVLRMDGVLPDGGRAARVVVMMERQLGHLVHLVNDLLDLSRVSQGKITLRRERVTAAEVVEGALEACRPTVEEKRHDLQVDVAGEPLAVDGDRTRLVQILSNLLTNAAKYSEPGGRITLSVRRDGAQVVFAVADTGVGIAPEVLPTLWDIFSQVRDTLDKAQGGLGIGLSLVKKLTELHGGVVSADSAGLGQGSTFTVRLPLLAEGVAVVPAAPSGPQRASSGAASPPGGPTPPPWAGGGGSWP